jgi:hypothetical protein
MLAMMAMVVVTTMVAIMMVGITGEITTMEIITITAVITTTAGTTITMGVMITITVAGILSLQQVS